MAIILDFPQVMRALAVRSGVANLADEHQS